MKLLILFGSGTLSVTVGLSGVGPPPTLTRSHVFAIWMYPGAPLPSPPARDAAAEDRFVETERAIDVGDGEKMRNGKPVARGHLVALLLDLCAAHGCGNPNINHD